MRPTVDAWGAACQKMIEPAGEYVGKARDAKGHVFLLYVRRTGNGTEAPLAATARWGNTIVHGHGPTADDAVSDCCRVGGLTRQKNREA